MRSSTDCARAPARYLALMAYIILTSLAMLALTLPATLQRRGRPWPREGHGATYFSRPALRQ
ncbi:MAG TPA: hypothetical protein VGT07_06085 [Steroidobacteraceae bacterium]|nr:hypothetical protein [Steroidobacteraceae bacterium]